MKDFTKQHLDAARLMPKKSHPLWLGDKADKQYRRKAKAERRIIARYYRLVRNQTEVPRIAHRYAVVTTAAQAKTRLAALEECHGKETSPA